LFSTQPDNQVIWLNSKTFKFGSNENMFPPIRVF